MDWKKDWQFMLRFRDEASQAAGGGIVPHRLQFANCRRIEQNDAVYLFDEVGSGKTIMAGLMALHYLYNHQGKQVLVITTNALAQGERGGQFLNDWYSRLPFDALGLKGRTKVINHHPARIRAADPSKYGLVILDEAQVFLNSESGRCKELALAYEKGDSLTEKVVFLTATPIKGSMHAACSGQEAKSAALEDLNRYREIAKRMLPPNPAARGREPEWEKLLNTSGRKEDLICAGFDAALPFTRYFKDTLLNLDEPGEGYRSPERGLPLLWYWNREKAGTDPTRAKEFVLLKGIREILEKEAGGRRRAAKPFRCLRQIRGSKRRREIPVSLPDAGPLRDRGVLRRRRGCGRHGGVALRRPERGRRFEPLHRHRSGQAAAYSDPDVSNR